MRDVLISSYDMEVGGVERSLASMLDNFDYESNDVDLMLFRHQGEFMNLISNRVRLLDEIEAYSTFRKPIRNIASEKQYGLALSRLLSKFHTAMATRILKLAEPGYYQMQLMWRYALPFLPRIDKRYDVAISYLWPHDFVAERVKASKKIAWIHTDYSKIETNEKLDFRIWNKFDDIIAVSEDCRSSFLQKYGALENKVKVIENITSPEFIRKMSAESVENPMKVDKRLKLLTVARFSHAKGIDNAVRALKLLRDKGFKHIAWYVVGYGGDEASIRQLITDHNLENDFILLGKKINPYPYMKACDIYVQPSRYEGKAVTVTEAKILGKPVLITNYPTASSQINHGTDGIICDLSVEGIATGIEELYSNKNLRLELSTNNSVRDYGNSKELKKLYDLFYL